MSIDIGLIGCGNWGKNWARVVDDNQRTNLAWVCDKDTSASYALHEQYDVPATTKPIWDACEAVIIATPPPTHGDISEQALQRGKHVLVEKPATMSTTQLMGNVDIAVSRDLVYMVGHTFLYSDKIYQMLEFEDRLGDVQHYRFEWTNNGVVRDDHNVVWSVAPHPLSILFFLNSNLVESELYAHGINHLTPNNLTDLAEAHLFFEDGKSASITVSWADPEKIRRITLLGTEGSLVCEPTVGEIRFYSESGLEEQKLIQGIEPLKAEMRDFIYSIQGEKTPVSDAMHSGILAVNWCEMINESIELGEPVWVE